MAETYTKTTHKSYGSRLGDSFKGIIGGFVLVGLGLWGIVWNEGRSVQRIKELNRSQDDVISVEAAAVNPANDNKLIHFYGRAVTDSVLTDHQFGVTRTNDLQLIRRTEIYQWSEKTTEKRKKNLGGSEDIVTTYTYEKKWGSSLADSSRFEHREGHENPAAIRFPSGNLVADDVKIGAFSIPTEKVSSIGHAIQVDMGSTVGRVIPAGLPTNSVPMDNGWYIPGGAGGKPSSPQVGDERVTFSYVPQCDATVIAVQLGSTVALKSPKYGPILIHNGVRTAEEILESAKSANSTLTWIIRLIAFLAIFGGFKAILNPLRVLADVVPFIGSVVGFGTGLVSFVLALVLSLLTIAIAWLAYRPFIAIPLIAAAAALVFYIAKKGKKKARPETEML